MTGSMKRITWRWRIINAQIEKLEEEIIAMPAPKTASLLASVKGLNKLLPRLIASEIGDRGFRATAREGKGKKSRY